MQRQTILESIIDALNTPITLSMFGFSKRKSFEYLPVEVPKPKATANREPSTLTIEGDLQATHGGYTVGGCEFVVSANTCVVGSLSSGVKVRAKVVLVSGRKAFARSVVVIGSKYAQ